jgi:anti-anti-sigma factor
MEIIKKIENGVCDLSLVGRLDTTTAPDLENEIKNTLTEDIKELNVNLEQLDYISSAGLRVLLFAQKTVNSLDGKMFVKNVKPEIMEVFEITGFTDILTIE